MSWLWRKSRRAGAETLRLVVDDEGVQRDLVDGRHEEVTWAELQQVRITVLPRGPWPDRLRVILDGGGLRGCIVPRDVAEEHGLVAALGRLPGLDVRRLAHALEQERVGTTVLWTRPH